MKKLSLRPVVVGLVTVMLANCYGTTCFGQLMSYWNFDDGATAMDQIGSNDGISFEAGATHSTDVHAVGPGGGAFSLDVTAGADYVTLPPVTYGISNQYTISAWVKRNGDGSGRFFSIKRDLTSAGGDRSGINLGLNGSNVYGGLIMLADGVDPAANGVDTFHDYSTTATSVSSIAPDTWTHVAVTLKDDFIKLYVNGVAETLYAPGGGAGFDTGQLKALAQGQVVDFVDDDGSFSGFGADGRVTGGGPANDTAHFDGWLDEVAVWNVAIPDSSIAELAQGALPPTVAVPEPSAVVLFCVGSVALWGRGRRRK